MCVTSHIYEVIKNAFTNVGWKCWIIISYEFDIFNIKLSNLYVTHVWIKVFANLWLFIQQLFKHNFVPCGRHIWTLWMLLFTFAYSKQWPICIIENTQMDVVASQWLSADVDKSCGWHRQIHLMLSVTKCILTLYFNSWQNLVRGWLYRDILFSSLTIFGTGMIISWHYFFTPDNIWWGGDYIVTFCFHPWQYLVRGWLYCDIIFSLLIIFGEGVIISWQYILIPDTPLESGTGSDYIYIHYPNLSLRWY